MRIPVIKGTIKRRLLVNFRADPAVVQRILPPPFRPKLHRDHSVVGIALVEASAFFEGGSLGYSVTRKGDRLDGLLLRTMDWRIRAFSATGVHSSFFADRQRFPEGSVVFDHALVMRDTFHEWHKTEDL